MGKKDKKVDRLKIKSSQQDKSAIKDAGVSKSSKQNKNKLSKPKKLKEVVQTHPEVVNETKKGSKREKNITQATSSEKVHIPEVTTAKKKKKSKKDKEVVEDCQDIIKKDKERKKAKVTLEDEGQEKKPKIDADIGVETSESEDDQESADVPKEKDVDQSISSQHSELDPDENGSKDDENADTQKKKRFPGPEHSVFIGNLPNTVKKSTMKTLFKQFGTILTIRFRTFDGIALPRKKDKKQLKALNCYVRFETREEALAACCMNGEMVEGNRIRVSLHSQKQLGHIASTVFVGNIHRKTTDNEIYDFFSKVGDIEYVRQIADKGIGYVCFKKGVSIAKALKMNQQLLNGRPLRIMNVDPKLQNKRQNKKGNLVNRQKVPTNANKNPRADAAKNKNVPQQEFHGTVAKTKNKKHGHNKVSSFEKKKKMLAKKLTSVTKSNK